MALQSECHVTVTESRQHQLSPDSASPTQILTLRVDSVNPAVRHFDIRYVFVLAWAVRTKHRIPCPRKLSYFSTVSRLNSTEYAEFRGKLHAPIRNSANVVIQQTISELFLETFRAQVDLNQRYTLPNGQVCYCLCVYATGVLESSCTMNLKNVLCPNTGDRALHRLYAGSSKHQAG